MPHTRKWLIQGGSTFENAFVHTPICCPSRSSILTGRYLHNGAARNNSLTGNCYSRAWRQTVEPFSYAVHAQKAGYRTAYAGKYLNQYGTKAANITAVPPGWDHWFGLIGNSRYYNYGVVRSDDNGTTVKVQHYNDTYEHDYLPNVLRDYAVDLLNQFNNENDDDDDDDQQQPWLLVVSWPTPHAPFIPAPWAKGKFDGTQAPRTVNFNASSSFMQQKHWLLRQLEPLDATVTKEIDRIYASRLETLLSVDDHVGDFMRLLQGKQYRDGSTALDSTIAIYTSDHGFQFGQHRLAIDKRHLYEHDIRVPFVIRGPGIPASRTLEKLILNIDLAPTIVDVVNNYEFYHGAQNSRDETTTSERQPISEYMDGASFWRYVTTATPVTADATDDPFLNRRDFLVSYNGEGSQQCGVTDCPIPQPPEVWYMPDSYNNTYHCVRTLDPPHEDSMYCLFEDDDAFVEFYNLTSNPWQLDNDYSQLSKTQKDKYAKRLAELLVCRGPTCKRSSRQRQEVIGTKIEKLRSSLA